MKIENNCAFMAEKKKQYFQPSVEIVSLRAKLLKIGGEATVPPDPVSSGAPERPKAF